MLAPEDRLDDSTDESFGDVTDEEFIPPSDEDAPDEDYPSEDTFVPPSEADQDDIPEEAPASKTKKHKQVGLKLSDTAPDELFDSHTVDDATGLERETSLYEILHSGLKAPAMTVPATEKQVAGAIAAILDSRIVRTPRGWYVATAEGWEEIDQLAVRSTIKSLIGRPDMDDKATRAIIPFKYRKVTRQDLLNLPEDVGLDDIPTRIPEADDSWAESSDTARRIAEDLGGRASVYLKKGFDSDPYLINAGGLVIDLSPSIVDEIVVRPLSRHDHIMQSLAARYDADAECPLWEKFVSEVMSVPNPETGEAVRRPEMERFLQVTAGLSLVGDMREQIALVYQGDLGSNGKSVYAGTLLHVFGTYGTTLPKAVLMEKRADAHTTDLTELEGARFAYAKETKRGRWDAEQYKELASREPLKARRMRENNIEFAASHLLHITSNNMPGLPSGDAAAWRRTRVVQFLMRWYSDGDRDADKRVSIGPIDPDLATKLEAEAPGILNWLIDGLRLYYSDGELHVPEDVRRVTEEARRNGSLWAEFLIDHVELTEDDGDTILLSELWSLWKEFKSGHSMHDSLNPTSDQKLPDELRKEMPSVQLQGGRVPGKRNSPKHFTRLRYTEDGLALRDALLGKSTDGVVVPFTAKTSTEDAPFTPKEMTK
ncbi:phage/plasmid primase, P4 family [Mycolicibacterium fortuitum]|uniref:DNA primase family protein n=1 Tax=Mycolicibacterium fortuitum TaxID=1766 RepID=UPI001CDD09DB|nr:phage/plasmid primase, P4 family [Mycolicibacterium fortuitum]UBV14965.1 hypothetical protein H8Z57_30505 [Mycolicibacterium fortuitum]